MSQPNLRQCAVKKSPRKHLHHYTNSTQQHGATSTWDTAALATGLWRLATDFVVWKRGVTENFWHNENMSPTHKNKHPQNYKTIQNTFVRTMYQITHWGRVKLICVNKRGHQWFRSWLGTCLVPSHNLNQCRPINWNFGDKFSEILIKTEPFLIKKSNLKMLSAKWRPFCLDLNVINNHTIGMQGSFWVWAWPMRDDVTM